VTSVFQFQIWLPPAFLSTFFARCDELPIIAQIEFKKFSIKSPNRPKTRAVDAKKYLLLNCSVAIFITNINKERKQLDYSVHMPQNKHKKARWTLQQTTTHLFVACIN
jgi:3-methyladenine DNA glycosylase AlkC